MTVHRVLRTPWFSLMECLDGAPLLERPKICSGGGCCSFFLCTPAWACLAPSRSRLALSHGPLIPWAWRRQLRLSRVARRPQLAWAEKPTRTRCRVARTRSAETAKFSKWESCSKLRPSSSPAISVLMLVPRRVVTVFRVQSMWTEMARKITGSGDVVTSFVLSALFFEHPLLGNHFFASTHQIKVPPESTGVVDVASTRMGVCVTCSLSVTAPGSSTPTAPFCTTAPWGAGHRLVVCSSQ